MLVNLVLASNTEVNATLADEGWDVGGWEEDEGDWEVLDEGNVEAVLTAELNIGSLEKVQGGGIKAALWIDVSVCNA